MSLSKFLNDELKKSGLNKAQFAHKMANMHPTELTRILNSTPGKLPSKNILDKLSRGLELSVDELIRICTETDEAPPHYFNSKKQLMEAFYPELEARSLELQRYCNPDQILLDPTEISQALRDIDDKTFHPHPDYLQSAAQWSEITKTYPKSSKIFYFEEEEEQGKLSIHIIGNWSLVFLQDDLDDVLSESGELKNDALELKNLSSMAMPGVYLAYVSNMSLKNQYNSYEYTPMVVESFLRQMEDYAKYGIRIKKLYANVYDRDIGFYKALGFTEIASPQSRNSSEENIPHLYMIENFPQGFVFPHGNAILQRIQKYYNDCQL